MKTRIALASTLALAFAAQSDVARVSVSADGLWRTLDETSRRALTGSGGERVVNLRAFRTVALDEARLATALDRLREGGASRPAEVLSLPGPDGTFPRFRVVEAPILAPGLAASYPAIRTFTGQGLDDPTATARLDVTPLGFHAQVLSASGRFYVDPYRRGDTATYVSYSRRDAVSDERFSCGARAGAEPLAGAGRAPLASGATLRTYRLALAATAEYTAFHGGTVGAALAAMTTTMNRVVGIYEREVAIRFTLVANTNLLVYTNASSDPYTNDDGSLMIDENQLNLDSVIGANNYDLGHVFSTGGGGVAGFGVACVPGQKAWGVTGRSKPVGDPFDVDYVAHEMGHQLGASHTFNGTSGFCNGNRVASFAYEPGSGSTIMSYAGLCDAENLQANSDAYFHAISYAQIAAYTTTGAGSLCGTVASTGNTPPVVIGGSSRSIPVGTPFSLTAIATDADNDPLTTCWEELDLGAESPPDTDDGSRPIFRSFPPSVSSTRSFPRLADVLTATSTFGESLPVTSRSMTFRVTSRDNRSGGGGVATAGTTLTTVVAAGPFQVTSPNTAVVWQAGTSQAVTWSVAGTNLPPVSCANVKITLSTDGGKTFGTTLLASTPNDGSQSVVVPNAPTAAGRVKVECATNVFYDVGNADFAITALPNTQPGLAPSAPLSRGAGDPGTVSTIATVSDAESTPAALAVRVTSAPAGISVTDVGNDGGIVTARVSAACAVTGANVVGLEVSDGALTKAASLTVNVSANTTPPVVSAPAPRTVTVNQTTCAGGAGATLGGLQVRFPSQGAALSALLNGGSATDDCTASPGRLATQLLGADVSGSTLFPVGTSAPRIRFADAEGNVASSPVYVTVMRQGDVDLNGAVDVFDNLDIQSLLVGNLQEGVPPHRAPRSVGDADGNGVVDIFDVVLHQGFIVGNVSCLTP